MAKPNTTIWSKRGSIDDLNNLTAALTAIVHREGEVFVPNSELEKLDGAIGLRARYEKGGIRLWTYDQLEEMKRIHDAERNE